MYACLTNNNDIFGYSNQILTIFTDLHTVDNFNSSFGTIRLVGEVSNGQGVVEVLTSIGWSTIFPDSSWTNSEATSIPVLGLR